jgi:hypothetical protein
MRGFFITLLLLLSVGTLFAQTPLKVQRRITAVHTDSTYSLMGRVDPESIKVFYDTLRIDPYRWRYTIQNQTWILLDSTLNGKELIINYSTSPSFPPILVASDKIKPYPTDSGTSKESIPTSIGPLTRADIFGNTSIQRSGSLSRGISFGTNRDASLESGLRLDLSGNISDDIEILATLTDQSTPIQPEGTTQTLREFDQVYLRLRGSMGQIQMGDVDVALQKSTFARVNRRLQGVDLIAHTKMGNQRATASVSRGIFRIQQFNGIDGVQGPYRLTGASGEVFIIILAGTENVYLDGVKMTRGEQNDYVIDYGLGEIRFTNNRFISSKTRINVDFQYLSQQYSRSLLAAESSVDGLLGGKISFLTTVIREADSDNSNNQLFLNRSEIEILRRAGDAPNLAVVSGVEPWDPTEQTQTIRYVRRDTLISAEKVVYYVSSNDPSKLGYSIRFSRTASRRGDYIRSGTTLNGFVFEYVGPGNGEYDTLRTITSPESKQLASLQSTLKLNRFLNLSSELAVSSLDKNRFSSADDEDNEGFAYTSALFGSLHGEQPSVLTYRLQHRYISSRFSFFDRARSVEFDRIWNITDADQVKERSTDATMTWQPTTATTFQLDAGKLSREQIQSDRIQLRLNSAEQRLPHLSYHGSIASSVDSIATEKGNWLRHGGQLSTSNEIGDFIIQPGFRLEHENRHQKNLFSDSLSANSLKFIEYGPFLSFRPGHARWNVNLSSLYRNDEIPLSGALVPESQSNTHSIAWVNDQGLKFYTEQSIGFRSVRYDEHIRTAQRLTNNVQVRSLIRYNLFNRFIDAQWNYDISSERRAKLQERYVDVGPELGSYIWEDENGDGIQDIDEFFPERIPGEGTYMLQFVPIDDFIPVTSLETGLRHVFRFSELSLTSDHPFWKRAEFSSRLFVKEINSSNVKEVYALKLSNFQGVNTIQGRQSAQHELRISQGLTKFGVVFSHDFMKSSNAFSLGAESNLRNIWRTITQYRINEQWSTEIKLLHSIHTNDNEQLSSRRYNIKTNQIESSVHVRSTNKWNTRFTTYFADKTDRKPLNPVDVKSWGLDAETNIYFVKASRTRVSVGRRVNTLTGKSSSYGLYELTDGGAEGVVWSAALQSEYRISDFVRASLQYDIRHFEGKKALQTMRFVVSAIL